MSLSILNVGCTEEDVLLIREAASMEGVKPLMHSALDASKAEEWANTNRPHLIIIDARTRRAEIIDLLRAIRSSATGEDIPILAVVDEYRRDDRGDMVMAGATDVITAPLDPYECRARVLNLVELGVHRRELLAYKQPDLRVGAESSLDITPNEIDGLRELADADGFHNERVKSRVRQLRRFSRSIAQYLDLPRTQCDLIEAAAPMHDIGNVYIAASILQSPGRLTASERKEIEMHTIHGHNLLKDKGAAHLQCAAEIALSHHERYDGRGYPHGVSGKNIPLPARIVAVADVYGALGSARPYRAPWPAEQIHQYLQDERGKHFDPDCVDALFLELGKTEHL